MQFDIPNIDVIYGWFNTVVDRSKFQGDKSDLQYIYSVVKQAMDCNSMNSNLFDNAYILQKIIDECNIHGKCICGHDTIATKDRPCSAMACKVNEMKNQNMQKILWYVPKWYYTITKH